MQLEHRGEIRQQRGDAITGADADVGPQRARKAPDAVGVFGIGPRAGAVGDGGARRPHIGAALEEVQRAERSVEGVHVESLPRT